MSKDKMNPKVDFYFDKDRNWHDEIAELRKIILSCGLSEDLKWGVPCYTDGQHNIVLIHIFKEYCAILFFKGALLKDNKHILIQQTVNVQAARQIRFTSLLEISKLTAVVRHYIKEAIKIEKAGLEFKFKKTEEFNMPEEFRKRLEKNRSLKTAFEKLTPGRQRAYLLYFSSAKQMKTRESRIEQSTPDILKGRGLNDR